MRSAQRPKLALVVRGGRGQAAGVQDRGRGGSEKGGKGVQGFIEEIGINCTAGICLIRKNQNKTE